jgi:hypothetical protein
MPSDAVTITAALAAPTVAGVVAVIIHRQRLVHESRHADLIVVRELLARGAERGMQLERAMRTWLYAEPPDPDPAQLIRDRIPTELDQAADQWRIYAASLQVFFPESHPVLTAAGQVDSALVRLLMQGDRVEENHGDRLDLRPHADDLSSKLVAWRAAARDVARAKV